MATGSSFRALLGSGDQIGPRAAFGTENHGAFAFKSQKLRQKAFADPVS